MKMRNIFTILLAVCLLASFCLPMPVMAAEAEEIQPESEKAWWEDGLPAPMAAFLNAFDALCEAAIAFAKTVYTLARYIGLKLVVQAL